MRGFGILKRYCPGLAQGKALYELINSIQPFISVWFSARIINEICTQRSGNRSNIRYWRRIDKFCLRYSKKYSRPGVQ